MAQSLSKNLIHLVFSTKLRRPDLKDEFRSELHAYMATVLKNLKCTAIVINSVNDHVHLFYKLHQTVSLAKSVEEVKKSSSKWLKAYLPNFSWQAGYGAFSVSESNKLAVIKYIENQAEHHRKLSFKEELRVILEKHNVPFDEKYLWD